MLTFLNSFSGSTSKPQIARSRKHIAASRSNTTQTRTQTTKAHMISSLLSLKPTTHYQTKSRGESTINMATKD